MGRNSIAAMTPTTDATAARIAPASMTWRAVAAATPALTMATEVTAATMMIHRYDWSRLRVSRTASAALAPDASRTGRDAGELNAGWADTRMVSITTVSRPTRRSYSALTTMPTNAIGTSSGEDALS